MRTYHSLVLTTCLFALAVTGCMSSQPNFNSHGVVFYCDGAGGGGITNWGPGVQKGLKDAGFTGTFDEFRWETGLGVLADQTESVAAKRAQAKKLARLQTSKFLHRLLGQYLVVKTFAPLALRAIDFKALFKGYPILNSLRILMGRLKGERGRDLSYRYMNVPHVLRVVIFPFEEYHSLDSAKLRNCKAIFAYEDVDEGTVKTIPACAWNTFRNEILRKIADKYNQSACMADSVECQVGV